MFRFNFHQIKSAFYQKLFLTLKICHSVVIRSLRSRHSIATLLHCYIVTLLHCYTVTLLHCYIATLLHCYTVTLLHCYIATLLHCYIVTLLHCYGFTLLEDSLSRLAALSGSLPGRQAGVRLMDFASQARKIQVSLTCILSPCSMLPAPCFL
jgi:hypothetical protein